MGGSGGLACAGKHTYAWTQPPPHLTHSLPPPSTLPPLPIVQFIGGGDDTDAAARNGKLEVLLKKAGVPVLEG